MRFETKILVSMDFLSIYLLFPMQKLPQCRIYIGETDRRFGTRQKEYKKNTEHLEEIGRPCHEQEPYYQLGWCETPSKRNRLEEDRCDRSHLHQEGGWCYHLPKVFLELLCYEIWSCGIFMALMKDLVGFEIYQLVRVFPNSPYPQRLTLLMTFKIV